MTPGILGVNKSHSEETVPHALKVKTDFPSVLFPDLRVSRPLIAPGYPENTTGLVGGQSKLACKVHRPASTKVQWLKTEVIQGGPPRLRALTVRNRNNLMVSILSSSY